MKRRFFVTFFSFRIIMTLERSDSLKRMRCNLIGIVALTFGAGVLIGGLLPSWIVVWILGITLLLVGVFLIYG